MREKIAQIESSATAKAIAQSYPVQAPNLQEHSNAAASLLALQRTHGNRFVQRMLSAGLIQPKLAISQPDDKYELEADRIAAQVMRMAEPGAEDEDEVFAKAKPPHVQRKCSACEEEVRRKPIDEEEEEVVQPKLKIGPSHDAYEQEADRVAAQVMSEPNNDRSSLGGEHSIAQGTVSRSFIEQPGFIERPDGGPLLQRQSMRPEDEEDSQLKVLRKAKCCDQAHESNNAMQATTLARSAEGGANKTEEESLSEGALTLGGEPLPQTVRTFYEDRFGRDFNDVRVHTGAESAMRSEAIQAYAFTYGNHVWLGQGQGVEPSLLLAHELTHVIQQKQPPRLQPKKRRSDPGADAVDNTHLSSPPMHASNRGIQRYAPYWEPSGWGRGRANHRAILREMSAQNGIFTEAPVPNADSDNVGYFKRGSADFYSGRPTLQSTTVGVFFTDRHTPAYLDLLTGTRAHSGGGVYSRADHLANAAPVLLPGTTIITKIDQAPSLIKIGDLKPSHETEEAVKGKEQLSLYQEGFEMARDEINSMRAWKDPPDARWHLNVTLFDKDELGIPPQFVCGSNSSQDPVVLGLRGVPGRGKHPEWFNNTIRGRMCIRPDLRKTGIWNYFWVPDPPPDVEALPPTVRALGPDIEARVINPLLDGPLEVAGKAKPGASAIPGGVTIVTGPAVSHDRSAKVRRVKTVKENDRFDLTAWNKAHKELTTRFNAETKKKEFKDVQARMAAVEAQENIRERYGVNVPTVGDIKEARALGKIDFWTGPSSKLFGPFRKIFGTAFIKVAQLYVKARDRFRALLKTRSRAGGKSGLLGSALSAAFKVIKLAGAYVVNRTIDRLVDSLVTGVTEKIKGLISGEAKEELEKKVEEVKKLQDEFERKAVDTVETLLGKTVGPYLDKLKQIEEVQSVVSDILTVIKWVRWGARALACLSPPGFGCLWILAESAIEWLASKVVETCWFARKITPLISGISFIQKLPDYLAGIIIEKIKDFLPASMHDIFANVDRSEVPVSESDIECEDADGDWKKMTPEREEMMKMQAMLGDEKFQALTWMMTMSGVDKAKPLPASEIAKMTETIAASDVTAEEMTKFAKNYKAKPGDPVMDIKQLLEEIKKGSVSGSEGEATETPPETEGEGGGEKKAEESEEAASGGGNVPTVDAKNRLSDYDYVPTGDSDAQAYIMNQSWSHTVGDRPKLDMIGFWKGEPKIIIRGIDSRVEKRVWMFCSKPVSSREAADSMWIHYRLQLEKSLSFDPIPMKGLAKDDVRIGLLETERFWTTKCPGNKKGKKSK